MSSTTAPVDFSDLYTALQNAVRVATGVTATEVQAKRAINLGLLDMHVGGTDSYPWAERRAVLRLQPPYTTGTVAITKGSTTVTGTSTAWNTNNDFGVANVRAGGRYVLAGGSDVYEVSSVGSDTGLVSVEPFISTTVTESTYTYFEDEYDLASDFMRPVDQQKFADGGHSIDLLSRTEFRRRYPQNNLTGLPVVAHLVDRPASGNTTPRRRIRFHRPPDQEYLIPYNYVTKNLAVSSAGTAQEALSADDDEPIVYQRYRHAILFHALYHWYLNKKDDTRSQEAKAEYTDLILRVRADNEVGSPHPQLRPRISHYVRSAKRPWGGSGRRYDVNNAFDRLER